MRLVTKQALRREGECMDNCLARGQHEDSAGEEDLVSTAIWSLRKATGISYMTASVYAQREATFVGSTAGPSNSQPSVWSIKQLRHLVAAFRDAGATLWVPEAIALTGEDGRTWRPDKAPQEMRAAIESERRQTLQRDQENLRLAWAAAGRPDHPRPNEVNDDPWVLAMHRVMRSNIVGDGPIGPGSDAITCGIDLNEGGPSVSYFISGPGVGQEHRATIPAGARDGDIFELFGNGERAYNVTVSDEILAANAIVVDAGIGVFRVIGDRTEASTFAFTAPSQALVPLRRVRYARRDAASLPGPIITDLSSKIRMTPIQMTPVIRALADGVFVSDDAGPGLGPGGGGDSYVIMAPGGWSSTRHGPPLSEG